MEMLLRYVLSSATAALYASDQTAEMWLYTASIGLKMKHTRSTPTAAAPAVSTHISSGVTATRHGRFCRLCRVFLV